MVNIFSFFTGKKKSKRSTSWTDAPISTNTAHLVGTSSGTHAASTPAQQSVKRQTSRFLSLRNRSTSKMLDSPQDALHRQSSIGSLRRKASRRNTVSTILPKFGFEGDNDVEPSLGKELAVSGSTLGLENLVGLPKLRDSEVDVICAVELSVSEAKECWDLFGRALRDTGEPTSMVRELKLTTRVRNRWAYASSTPRPRSLDCPSATGPLSLASSTILSSLLSIDISIRSLSEPKTTLFRLITKRH